MTSFVHLHSSSKYNRSAESLERAVEVYNSVADLVTLTEVEFERREGAVRRANEQDFGFVSGDESNHNDCGISYRRSRFRLVYSENFLATKRDYGTQPLYATIAVLEDKNNGKRFVVSVVHLPSHVEDDLHRDNRTARTLAWFNAFRRVKRRANRLGRCHHAQAVLLVADYNINFKRFWVRALVKSLAPNYRHTWRDTDVRGGTHDNRIIDATLKKGKIKVRRSAELFKDDDSSDHRPYIETLIWR